MTPPLLDGIHFYTFIIFACVNAVSILVLRMFLFQQVSSAFISEPYDIVLALSIFTTKPLKFSSFFPAVGGDMVTRNQGLAAGEHRSPFREQTRHLEAKAARGTNYWKLKILNFQVIPIIPNLKFEIIY